MENEYQVAAAVAVFLIGTVISPLLINFLKFVFSANKDRKSQVDTQITDLYSKRDRDRKELTDYKIYVAENYVTKTQIREFEDRILSEMKEVRSLIVSWMNQYNHKQD